MVKRRVIAFPFHEEEWSAVRAVISDEEETDSFIVGDVEEDDIKMLVHNRIIVRILDDPIEPETPSAVQRPFPRIELRQDRRFPRPRIFETVPDPTKAGYFLIQLRGPLLDNWRDRFRKLKVKLLEYIPRYSYVARLTKSQIPKVRSLKFVDSIRPYTSIDAGPIAAQRSPKPVPKGTMLTHDIRLHQPKDMDKVLKWLKRHKIDVAGKGRRKIRIYLIEDSPLVDEIASLPEVALVEEYVPPELHNDVALTLLGVVPPPGANRATNITQTGAGQIVAVADTGIDNGHPDFSGRILGISALGRPNDSSDPHGHGTHVAGSVVGNGDASQGKIHGTAPGAQLYFQSIMDYSGALGGLPTDLGDLFQEAYDQGARIHSNSWGAARESRYAIDSLEVDEFVAEHRDMLIVISAGNAGTAKNPLNAQRGFVDWLSIDAPATAKNALTVGASRSSRSKGGISNLTYGEVFPSDFPDPPIADENVSGDSECMAAFSSRGPCTDRRIKPDVVAPGTDIASTRSSIAPLRNFWGAYPNSNKYAFMGGTSMATPIVSGCAALVREYFVNGKQHTPSAALLKATLINGTRWLTGTDSVAEHATRPNFHQGFGCIYMPTTVPNPSIPSLRLEFSDVWIDNSLSFNRVGQMIRFRIRVSGGPEFRITLGWTDYPARALQNNLNLFVENIETREKWVGNADLPGGLSLTDADNNVEVIRISDPQPGDYFISVIATNLLHTPQDFALVTTGEFSTDMILT